MSGAGSGIDRTARPAMFAAMVEKRGNGRRQYLTVRLRYAQSA